MKKSITIFRVIIFASFTLSSCGESKKSNEIELPLIEKDYVSNTNTKIIPETYESVTTIKIGQQEWMTEDINTSVYNNGNPINMAINEKQWAFYSNKKIGCYRKLSNGTYIYNGYAVNDKRGILPSGFILPTYYQFNELFNYLGGGESSSGKATKSMVTYPIYIEDWVGDQETGGLESIEIKTNNNSKFNAKKGGFVYDTGTSEEGNCSYWWTASSEGAYNIVVGIGNCSQDIGSGKLTIINSFGFSIRAIKK